MRISVVAVLPILLLASPAASQRAGLDGRIGNLEAEMRAVQRKVFPRSAVKPPVTPAAPADDHAVGRLTTRIDGVESQLAKITGQTEEAAYRARRLDEEIARLRAAIEANRIRMEEAKAAHVSPVSPEQAGPPPTGPASSTRSSGDPAEDAYLAGYRLWEQGKFAEAQAALQAMAKGHPKQRRASWAMNLAGRAALDGGQPATAARLLLANYQDNPKGERAPDSLFYLGQALTKVGKLAEACQAYDELQAVYGKTMRPSLKQTLPGARRAAKCK